jgi:hypothetical protein
MMIIQPKSTISGVTPCLLTSIATIGYALTALIVVMKEELELSSVERQLISYQ